MTPLGPFEPTPVVAVGTSGGADSLALCLLAHRWVRARKGTVVALVVDHRLRPGSTAEAKGVKRRLERDPGIATRVLRRSGPPGGANPQAMAREARFRLMRDWCHRHGVLHLLLAHHLEDQAETFLLRLARGSGADGLAAMAPLGEFAGIRVLRPLLGVSRRRLRASLRARRDWIEDPSNADRRFARVRVRARAGLLADEGLNPARVARTAAHLARARAALDDGEADLLARALALDPAGFARLDPELFKCAPRETSMRALARVLTCIAGADYPPRFMRLERLLGAVVAGIERPRTLHGCRVIPDAGGLLVCREPAAAHQILPLVAGRESRWDGRFRISLGSTEPGDGLFVARLEHVGLRRIRAAQARWRASLPAAVCLSLPALWQGERLLAVPQLDVVVTPCEAAASFAAVFAPPRPLLGWLFAVA